METDYLPLIIKLRQIVSLSLFYHFLLFLMIFSLFLIFSKADQKQIILNELEKFMKKKCHFAELVSQVLMFSKDEKNQETLSFLC